MNWYSIPSFVTPFEPQIEWSCHPPEFHINNTASVHRNELCTQLNYVTSSCLSKNWVDVFKIQKAIHINSIHTPKMTGFVDEAISNDFLLTENPCQTTEWSEMHPNHQSVRCSNRVPMLYFEVMHNQNLWVISLDNLANNLADNGCCMFAVDGISSKLEVDILFFLSTVFTHVYFVSCGNPTKTLVYYVVCKYFTPKNCEQWSRWCTAFSQRGPPETVPMSLFHEHVPLLFRHKIEEIVMTIESRYIDQLTHTCAQANVSQGVVKYPN